MAHGRNKYQSRENRARVREIFLRDWDPIGVYGIPEAADEYDEYAFRAYVMLMDENATEREIAKYLFTVATEHMALSDYERLSEKSEHVAKILVGIRSEFHTH